MVKKHEDFPRHIFRLFLLLGIQFRWLLTRGTLGKALVTAEEAAIDDAKERVWMDLYETDRDTLEDVLYRRLQMLWDPFTDALKVFQKHNASLSHVVHRRSGKPFLLLSLSTTRACRLLCLLVNLLA